MYMYTGAFDTVCPLWNGEKYCAHHLPMAERDGHCVTCDENGE